MEGCGAVAVFQRSVDQNKLRYLEYAGDGDASSQEVNGYKPYGADVDIIKKECLGQVA